MMRNILIRRTLYDTFKSKNDEYKNQELLHRLKGISLIGGKKIVEPQVEDHQETERNVSLDKLSKIIKYHLEDPLVWNASILSRIYKVHEEHCENLLRYVLPFLFYADFTMDQPKKLQKISVVIDVARFKRDPNYYEFFQRLVFLKKDDAVEKEI